MSLWVAGVQGKATLENITLTFSVAKRDYESGVDNVFYFSRAASDLHLLWEIPQFLRANI